MNEPVSVFVPREGEASDLLAWSAEKHSLGLVEVLRESRPGAVRLRPPALIIGDFARFVKEIAAGSAPLVSDDVPGDSTVLLRFSLEPDETHPSWELWCAYRTGMLLDREGHAFDFAKRRYRYFCHPRNLTWKNERIVEIPIALAAIAKAGRILEVGDVLRQYGAKGPRDIVDLGSETAVQQDVLAYRGGPFDLIISISTLEHVGRDDGTEDFSRAIAAVKHLCGMLRPGGRLLFTVPVGYNPVLDAWLYSGWAGTNRYMLRVSKDNRWVECDEHLPRRAQYGVPYRSANALIVGEYLAPNGEKR